MPKISIAVILVVTLLLLSGCTSNQMAKSYGGTMTIDLPKGEKLVTATWKENSLWYLTRPSHDGEKPEKLMFREDSNFGIMKGTVIFQEH